MQISAAHSFSNEYAKRRRRLFALTSLALLTNNITREQTSRIVSEAAGFHEYPGPQTYDDLPPTCTFYRWINIFALRGILDGYPYLSSSINR